MSDFWIVTSRSFLRHRTMEAAMAERDRLAAKEPARTFTLMRCKHNVESNPTRAHVRRLEAALRRLIEAQPPMPIDLQILEAVEAAAKLLPSPRAGIPRDFHRALVEAGYAPLDDYVARFGDEGTQEP